MQYKKRAHPHPTLYPIFWMIILIIQAHIAGVYHRRHIIINVVSPRKERVRKGEYNNKKIRRKVGCHGMPIGVNNRLQSVQTGVRVVKPAKLAIFYLFMCGKHWWC